MPRVFITGSTGFVGRAVIRLLADAGVRDAVLLVRAGADLSTPDQDWSVVRGDVLDPASYVKQVPRGGVVLHLAAATGKASAQQHHAVNVTGTERLITAARDHGVGHFIYVSSIAAAFTDTRYYPYADSKRAAEALVRASGIPYTIVRPTMVFGPGSAVQKGLATIARSPVPFVFGDGRVRVQPVHVNDLARVLVDLCAGPPRNETLVVGGPDTLNLEELIRRMRAAAGKKPGRIQHIPVAPVRALLALAGLAVGPLLPLTAGQLASFINDGAAGSELAATFPARIGLQQMISE